MVFVNLWASRDAQEAFAAASQRAVAAAAIGAPDVRVMDVYAAVTAQPAGS